MIGGGLQVFWRRTGLSLGSLPYKYLGVPISPKRLFSVGCHVLVDKMVERIRGWQGRRLSYAGRLVLIQSMLSTIHSYWSNVFILHMKVIKQIEQVCRNFLWSGAETRSKIPQVAWEDLCNDKRYGGLGLGLKNLQNWNIAIVGILAWWVATKAGHLWVQWVHHVYL
ncbi:hypothetical protein RND81_09G078600 [Saponaria officinalis]|uniref:Uncharacterized protein n=1 Tax=Saponaria officinalis TaxID=3572 RepID=A0AAW1IK76_SAPOF